MCLVKTHVIEVSSLRRVVNVDVVCLNHDGNVIDAAVKASVAALRNLTLPAVVVESDEDNAVAEDVIKVDASDRSPLRLGAQVIKTLDSAEISRSLF